MTILGYAPIHQVVLAVRERGHRELKRTHVTPQIRDFESELFESGINILKFFPHISKEEQLAHFEQRLNDPAGNWKISEADYSERELLEEKKA